MCHMTLPASTQCKINNKKGEENKQEIEREWNSIVVRYGSYFVIQDLVGYLKSPKQSAICYLRTQKVD